MTKTCTGVWGAMAHVGTGVDLVELLTLSCFAGQGAFTASDDLVPEVEYCSLYISGQGNHPGAQWLSALEPLGTQRVSLQGNQPGSAQQLLVLEALGTQEVGSWVARGLCQSALLAVHSHKAEAVGLCC